MTTIIAGGPGDPEVTPEVNAGECAGNMTNISIRQPMAMCRDNYGCAMLHRFVATVIFIFIFIFLVYLSRGLVLFVCFGGE
jgi:hypothetical protein